MVQNAKYSSCPDLILDPGILTTTKGAPVGSRDVDAHGTSGQNLTFGTHRLGWLGHSTQSRIRMDRRKQMRSTISTVLVSATAFFVLAGAEGPVLGQSTSGHRLPKTDAEMIANA